MIYDKSNFKDILSSLIDTKYQVFSQKLTNTKAKVLGIQIPKLRALARELSKSNWQQFFDCEENYCEEVIILKGLTLGYAKVNYNIFCDYLKKYFNLCDSWCSTDVVAGSLKQICKNQDETLKLIMPYFASGTEFQTRLAIIILMDYYIDLQHIDIILSIVSKIKSDYYYVNMAISWLISVCFVKCRTETLNLLSKKFLSKWVQNKAIQKCRESFRVSIDDKNMLLSYKICDKK